MQGSHIYLLVSHACYQRLQISKLLIEGFGVRLLTPPGEVELVVTHDELTWRILEVFALLRSVQGDHSPYRSQLCYTSLIFSLDDSRPSLKGFGTTGLCADHSICHRGDI